MKSPRPLSREDRRGWLRLRGFCLARVRRFASESMFSIGILWIIPGLNCWTNPTAFAPMWIISAVSASAPFLRVILIHWLFGEWAAFKERCEWSSILGDPSAAARLRNIGGVARGSVNSIESAIILEHRQVCLDYMRKCLTPSRLEFLKTNYRSFRWLLHRDRNWLDAQLPVPPKQVVQLGLFE